MLDSEVVLLATPPCAPWDVDVAVTINEGRANTYGGRRLDRAGIAFLYQADAPRAVEALCRAWQVDLFDPCWGRDSLLWELLDRWCHEA